MGVQFHDDVYRCSCYRCEDARERGRSSAIDCVYARALGYHEVTTRAYVRSDFDGTLRELTPDADGHDAWPVAAFRACCECGWLGELRPAPPGLTWPDTWIVDLDDQVQADVTREAEVHFEVAQLRARAELAGIYEGVGHLRSLWWPALGRRPENRPDGVPGAVAALLGLDEARA